MNASLAALQACLEKETRLMGDFMAILQHEARVLEDGATEDALNTTTASKNRCAEDLTAAASERNTVLQALGFGTDGSGLADATTVYPDLAPLRQALLDITEQARSLNDANGRIIDVFLDHNQRTLDTLRRLTGVGDIYDASGRTRSGNKGTGRNIKA